MTDFDILNGCLNVFQIEKIAKEITSDLKFDKQCEIEWLLKAISLIDLTTLAGDDSFSNVERLCLKAKRALSPIILAKLHSENVCPDFAANLSVLFCSVLLFPVIPSLFPLRCNPGTAAVCVYPKQIPVVFESLSRLNALDKIGRAAVATGFPSGQYFEATKLDEIREAVRLGANEIDIVIPRDVVLQGDFEGLFEIVKAYRSACPTDSVKLKSILAVGELASYSNVYRASMICMMAGSDFIKTSTGKESTVNATLPVGLVMCLAIRDFQAYQLHKHNKTVKIGFKPAGGIKTAKDALQWMCLVSEILGIDHLEPELLRLGASSLLGNIEFRIYELLFNEKCNPALLTI